ncbi:TMV resistance protein N [Arachis hypogaea]|nr:TMV resistance protein N [Arachis hypogaea]
MSSSEPKRWIYDVFLSFQGEDSRSTTASHLYNSLTQAGLYVFRDDEELQKGDQISPSLIRAIEASRISLVILSEHYAASTWCLEELEKIMECRRSIGQWVIPVFCDASPSKIRRQEGPIGEAFRQHLQTFSEDKVNLWRAVLRQVCSFSGVDLRCSRVQKLLRD